MLFQNAVIVLLAIESDSWVKLIYPVRYISFFVCVSVQALACPRFCRLSIWSLSHCLHLSAKLWAIWIFVVSFIMATSIYAVDFWGWNVITPLILGRRSLQSRCATMVLNHLGECTSRRGWLVMRGSKSSHHSKQWKQWTSQLQEPSAEMISNLFM